jgi:hypothetical protein
MTFLGELNRDIVDTHKSLADLNQGISVTLQESKKWTIISRFLSGTGLWAMQNKLRAVVSVLAEYNKGQVKQLENAQKNAELMEKLATRTESLKEAQRKYNEALAINSDDLEVNTAHAEALAYAHEMEIDILQALSHLTDIQSASLTDHIQKRKLLNQEVEMGRKSEEELNSVWEERQRIRDHYSMSEKDANTLMQNRLKLMKGAADAQDKILKGTDEQRKLLGKIELAQGMVGDAESSGAGRAAIHRAEAAIPGAHGGLVFSDAEKKKIAERALKIDILRNKLLLKFENIKGFMSGVAKFAKKGAMLFGKFLMALPFIMIGLFGLFQAIKVLKKNMGPMLSHLLEFLETMGAALIEGFGMIWAGISMVWEGLIGGDFMLMLEGLGKIAFGLFFVAVTALVALAVGVFYLGIALIIGFAGTIWNLIKAIVTLNFDEMGVYFGQILNFIGLALLFYGIYAFYMTTMVFTIGWIGIAVIAAVALLKSIGVFAHGGITGSGLSIVGEKGPELVRLPTGSRVHSNSQSRKMAGGNTINVHVNGRVGASDQEIRDIARKVGAQINREINRTTSSGTRM